MQINIFFKQISRKRAQRIALIRGYCKELKRKRYARTYHRFRTIRAMKMRLNDETMALCEQEIYDKGLTRTYYYDQDEPSEMVRFRKKYINTISIDLSFRKPFCNAIAHEPSSGNTSNTKPTQIFEGVTATKFTSTSTKTFQLLTIVTCTAIRCWCTTTMPTKCT